MLTVVVKRLYLNTRCGILVNYVILIFRVKHIYILKVDGSFSYVLFFAIHPVWFHVMLWKCDAWTYYIVYLKSMREGFGSVCLLENRYWMCKSKTNKKKMT